jgi:hypothetical protein
MQSECTINEIVRQEQIQHDISVQMQRSNIRLLSQLPVQQVSQYIMFVLANAICTFTNRKYCNDVELYSSYLIIVHE